MGVDIAKLKKANAERWQDMKIDSHLVAAIIVLDSHLGSQGFQ
jgi:hypothetical protein